MSASARSPVVDGVLRSATAVRLYAKLTRCKISGMGTGFTRFGGGSVLFQLRYCLRSRKSISPSIAQILGSGDPSRMNAWPMEQTTSETYLDETVRWLGASLPSLYC